MNKVMKPNISIEEWYLDIADRNSIPMIDMYECPTDNLTKKMICIIRKCGYNNKEAEAIITNRSPVWIIIDRYVVGVRVGKSIYGLYRSCDINAR